MARDTTTGSSFEDIVKACVQRSCSTNGLIANRQKFVGLKPGGGRHRIDWELVSQSNASIRGLISCKVQNTSGTADEKVAYEVIKLLYSMDVNPEYKKSWLILGGNAWTQEKINFLNIEMPKYVPKMNKGKIIIWRTDDLISGNLSLTD